MVTLAGTAASTLLLLRKTTADEVAALVSDTVQVVEEFGPTDDGEQLSVLSCAGATRLKLADNEVLPTLAVKTTVWLMPTVAAFAVKVALVCAELMTTPVGTVRLGLLVASETPNPPAGAPWVIDTVQVVLPGVLIVPVVHE